MTSTPADSPKRRQQRLARYPTLQEHREKLGWSVQDLLTKIEGSSVSERSVRRLEEGLAIRANNVHKVFNTIAKHYPEHLERDEHVVVA